MCTLPSTESSDTRLERGGDRGSTASPHSPRPPPVRASAIAGLIMICAGSIGEQVEATLVSATTPHNRETPGRGRSETDRGAAAPAPQKSWNQNRCQEPLVQRTAGRLTQSQQDAEQRKCSCQHDPHAVNQR